LRTTPENPFQTGRHSKDSTVEKNPSSPNSIYQMAEFPEEKRKGIKFKYKNFSAHNEHQKSRNQRYKTYVPTILVTIVGTSVAVLLIVAIVHQIRSIMVRQNHVNTSDPEPRGTYNEIGNVRNNL
jgi:hypothetical protein